MIRPEINQYFIESNTDGTPFDRETRSVVYQRSKRQLDTLPFGTQRDVYEQGYEWIAHSMRARPAPETAPRVTIGDSTCAQPYSASLLNISGMSYGALSKNAIRALNGGARAGGFYHNTGEGGLSPYHLEPGGDLMWQIGTGYFGCRREDGSFDPEAFAEAAAHSSVKLIEIKLSQGAKPGHGGILPAVKLTQEIADIRGVPMGRDVLSPPAHSAFTTPREMMAFLAMLREISGKPVGIKLCVGSQVEVMSLCRAMRETETHPDFIAVDGGEGGTGAAPLEFSNSVGMPLDEGLFWVHNCLVGFDLRGARTPDRQRKNHERFRHGQALGTGRRPVLLGARDDVGPGLHPGTPLQCQRLSGGGGDAEAGLGVRPGRRVQGRARAPLPRCHRAQPARAGRRSRPLASLRADPAARHAPRRRQPRAELRRDLSLPGEPGPADRSGPGRLRTRLAGEHRRPLLISNRAAVEPTLPPNEDPPNWRVDGPRSSSWER